MWSVSGSSASWCPISWRAPAPPASPLTTCWINYASGRTVPRERGDKTMWPDQSQMRLSSVGITLLVVCVAVGGGVMVLTESRTALAIGALAGLYFLFSIRVADQWGKV